MPPSLRRLRPTDDCRRALLCSKSSSQAVESCLQIVVIWVTSADSLCYLAFSDARFL